MAIKGQPEKFAAQQMIDALSETKGMVTLAAKRLHCSPNTVRRYVREYKSVAEAQRNATDELGDTVELTLFNEAIQKRNTAALIFLAKTKFKDRGYVERQENWNINVPPEQVKRLVDALEANGLSASDTFEEMLRQLASANAEPKDAG